MQVRLAEAEEAGYQGTYFASQESPHRDGYMTSSPEVPRRPFSRHHPSSSISPPQSPFSSVPPTPLTGQPLTSEEEVTAGETETETEMYTPRQPRVAPTGAHQAAQTPDEEVAEVVFFEYGVVVFFGLDEEQEMSILEDIDSLMSRKIAESDWEVEECHFAVRVNLTRKPFFIVL